MVGLGKLKRVARGGPFRASAATAAGIPRTYLQRWTQQGVLVRVGHGLYRLAASEPSKHGYLAEIARRAPRATVCLASALELHGMRSEAPGAVWLMVEGHGRAPRIAFVRTEIVRASGEAFHYGVEAHVIEGVVVHVTSPAKTVTDCFRFRRHLGLELALDALRAYVKRAHERRSPRYTLRHLYEAMSASRVASVMKPYVEALL